MYITVDSLLSNLSITTNWFFKVLRDCGFSQTVKFNIDNLIEFRNCLESKQKEHYKKKLLIKQINILIESLKVQS